MNPISGTSFTDPSPHEEVIAWGLPAGRLAVAAGTTLVAAACLHLPGPEVERLAVGTVTLLGGYGLAWIRLQGLPLATWASRTVRAVCRGRLETDRGPTHWRYVDGPSGASAGT